MISSPSDSQNELLQSMATSLKGIQSSLDRLTEAVEGVAESIETAHEPEGDLGHHLVGALKDISSALHKRAQQERLPLPQQRHNPPQHSSRREERLVERHDQQIPPQRENHPASEELESDRHELSDQGGQDLPHSEDYPTSQNPQTHGPLARKPRPKRRRGGATHAPKPFPPQISPSATTE